MTTGATEVMRIASHMGDVILQGHMVCDDGSLIPEIVMFVPKTIVKEETE